MFLIVLYHSWCHGVYKDENAWWSVFFCGLLIWHVDAFLAISGWFGIKFSLKRFWKIYSQALFYSLVNFGVICIYGGKWSGVTAGWFGGTYLMLVLIAPFLNIAIDAMQKIGEKKSLMVWMLFALGVTATWAPYNLFTAVNSYRAGGGYSILMFVFIYVTVRLIKLNNADLRKLSCLIAIICFVAFTLITGLISIFNSAIKGREIDWRLMNGWTSYDSPPVWIMAIAMLVLFVKYINLPVWLERICLFMSPSVFGIYLIHDTTSFGNLLYKVPQAYLSSHANLHAAIIIVVSAGLTYMVALCLDLVRRLIFRVIGSRVRRFSGAKPRLKYLWEYSID